MKSIGLVALAFPLAVLAASVAHIRRPNVILITIDTLRADHLSSFGYGRATTPNLDRLAQEGVLVRRCYSQSSETAASIAALFTSRYPRSNGVLNNEQEFSKSTSLMDVLRANGYYAAAFVSSIPVSHVTKIDREFDHFDDHFDSIEINRHDRAERVAGRTIRATEEWLPKRPQKPLFLWIHLIDPHGPYAAPVSPNRYVGDPLFSANQRRFRMGTSDFAASSIPAYQQIDGRNDAAFYIARYDSEIRYTDMALGRFFNFLKRHRLYDESIIIVSADHGETLDEPGHKRYFSHSVITYEETVHVPLIIKDTPHGGELKRLKSTAVTRLIDVVPTLLNRLRIPAPEGLQGRDLYRGTDDHEPVYSFGTYGDDIRATTGTQFTVLSGNWRYIFNSNDQSDELYDHRSDPKEMRNVAQSETRRTEQLRRLFRRFFRDYPAAGSATIQQTPEWRKQMKSLGYLQ